MPLTSQQTQSMLAKYQAKLESFAFAGGRGATHTQKDIIGALESIAHQTPMIPAEKTGFGGSLFVQMNRTDPQQCLRDFADAKCDADFSNLMQQSICESRASHALRRESGAPKLSQEELENNRNALQDLRTELRQIYASTLTQAAGPPVPSHATTIPLADGNTAVLFNSRDDAIKYSLDLANRGIVGASGNPKFVAQHVQGKADFGVILTPSNLVQLSVDAQPVAPPPAIATSQQQFKAIVQGTRNSQVPPSDYFKTMFSKLQSDGKFDGLTKGQTKQEGAMVLGITFGKELPSIQMGNIKVQLEKSGEVSAWEIGSKATPLALNDSKLKTMMDNIETASASMNQQRPG